MTILVYIPGTLCDRRVFEPMADHLSMNACFAEPIAHADVGDAAQAVLAAAPPCFIACGFSLGGFVVLEMMRRAPERLRGAIFIAGNAHGMQRGAEHARRADLAMAKRLGVEAIVDELWPSYVAPARQGREDLKERLRAMARDVGLHRFAAQTELAIHRPDSHATVRAAEIPILALCGADDATSPVARSESLTEAPHARLAVLSGVGHFLPLEAPEGGAAAITAWTEELALCC